MNLDESRSCRFVNETIADEPAIDNELTRLTPPITGYGSELLVTLEEACEPLETLINELQKYVAMAKRNSQNPADNLSQDESAAIHLYTLQWPPSENSLYIMLNRMLRAPDRSELTLKLWFKYLKLFLTALAKLPILSTSNRQPIVYRGVKINIDDTLYTPGSCVTWWAFSSCTTSISLLQSDIFLGTTGDRTIFNIETTTGKNISSHSCFRKEDEVLLMPATYMEVISRVNPAPQLHIIHLREKVPPVFLLEAPFEGTSSRLSHMYIDILV